MYCSEEWHFWNIVYRTQQVGLMFLKDIKFWLVEINYSFLLLFLIRTLLHYLSLLWLEYFLARIYHLPSNYSLYVTFYKRKEILFFKHECLIWNLTTVKLKKDFYSLENTIIGGLGVVENAHTIIKTRSTYQNGCSDRNHRKLSRKD